MKKMHGGVVGVLVFAAVAVMILWSTQDLRAQQNSPFTSSVYQYVGVNQTIARISNATGKIEILEQHNAPGLSLLHPQARPWEWREIRIRKDRTHRRGTVRTPDEADGPGRERHP
ncbi:MAG: hypothetical protein ACE5EQ_10590 [Phycisphaerae bacterium]